MEARSNVTDVVIVPLAKWFGRSSVADRADLYIEVLGRYSKQSLVDGMNLLKRSWTQQSVPQPAAVAKCCDEAISRNRTGSFGNKPRMPWEERADKIRQILQRFNPEATALYQRAVAEGWDKPFMKFARSMASFQAHVMVGSHSVPWDADMAGWCDGNEQMAYIRQEMDRAKQIADIDIQVPAGAIAYWREHPVTFGIDLKKYGWNT